MDGIYKTGYGLDMSTRPEDQRDILQCRNCDFVVQSTDLESKCYMCGDGADWKLTKSTVHISGRLTVIVPMQEK